MKMFLLVVQSSLFPRVNLISSGNQLLIQRKISRKNVSFPGRYRNECKCISKLDGNMTN